MLNPHPENCIRRLPREDVNGLVMVECTTCETVAHAKDEMQAKNDLANPSCEPHCANCQMLRRSHDKSPAFPMGGKSYNDRLHTCPLDGSKWWQFNTHFHLWKQVTCQQEWKTLQDG